MCPQASVEFDSMPLTLVEVGSVMGSPWEITVSWLTVSGEIPSRFQKTSYL